MPSVNLITYSGSAVTYSGESGRSEHNPAEVEVNFELFPTIRSVMASSTAGVLFPTDSSGSRSTGRLAKDVVADALSTVDPAASERVHRIKDWRKGYIEPFTELVSAGAVSYTHLTLPTNREV